MCVFSSAVETRSLNLPLNQEQGTWHGGQLPPWARKEDMTVARCNHGLVAYDDMYIFAFGSGCSSPSESIEKYKITVNEWEGIIPTLPSDGDTRAIKAS